MDDSKHCSKLRGGGALGAGLYGVEGGLERGAEADRELEEEEGDDGANEVGFGGCL